MSYLERGRLVHAVGAARRHRAAQAREALAEREQRFRDVVEASGEYVWETDAQWRYTYLSERVEAVLGYLRAEMIGRRRASSCRWARRARWRSGSTRTARDGRAVPRPGAPLDHQVGRA